MSALTPLREAIEAGRVIPSDTEDRSLDKFTSLDGQGRRLRYMRNWPVKYRELQQAGDPDAKAARLAVTPLPVGILGGQSLALVRRAAHASRARELIRFLTDEPAQKIIAAHGLAPTRIGAYSDANLLAFIPHLESVRGAVETSRPRPIHRNYDAFAHAFARHMTAFLHPPRENLPSGFIDDIRAALR